MFRSFIGSSSGQPEIQSKQLSLFYLHYGIPHAYRVKYKLVNYLNSVYIQHFVVTSMINAYRVKYKLANCNSHVYI